jgi:hypothetical protein
MKIESHVRPRRSGVALWALVALTAAGGCGNLTAGGIGEATVVVSGDADPVLQVPLQAALLPSVPAATSHEEEDDDAPEGEVEVEMELYLVSEAGDPIRLGFDEIRVRVDLGGETEADAVRWNVPATRYIELLVIFTEIEAEVDAGLIINGEEVTGAIDVDLEDVTLPVSRAIDLDIADGASVEVVLDLNAPAWLQAVDPATGLVDESVFAALVDVAVR